MLRELEKNMDGYQNSVKTVDAGRPARRLRGVIGPVSAILEVEPGREVAIETALGGALQNIVVENEAAAKAGIALLRSENAGRATFLPLDTVQPGVFRGRLSGSAKLASALVKAEKRYANIVSNLLGRIIVVDDINEASRVARDNGYHNKVVTHGRAGHQRGRQFYRRQRPAVSGVVHPQAGDGGAAAQGCRSSQKESSGRAGEDWTRLKSQTDAISAELTATASEQITAANDRVRAEAERKRLEAAVEQAETARTARQAEIDQLNAQLDASGKKPPRPRRTRKR